jgi:dihydropteroate synthase
MDWHVRDRILKCGRQPLVMGIVNVTPDSFSDGGRHSTTAAALAHALELAAEGADILDIGGESTRPGAGPVSLDEELRRVMPVVEALTGRTALPISVDTSKAEVARRALQAGAHIINDVTALRGDADMPEVARSTEAGVVLMHMQGTPLTMQVDPHYDDVVADLMRFFQERVEDMAGRGISPKRVVLDPGIGFGKRGRHNLEILARLAEFQALGRPLLLGVSRKAFIGKLLEQPTADRLAGSLAAVLYAQEQNAVQIVRVHDVRATKDAVTVFAAIQQQASTS